MVWLQAGRRFPRPSEGAVLHHVDPWNKWKWKKDGRTPVPPYIELTAAVSVLPTDGMSLDYGSPSQDLIAEIRTWCRTWGLLGLLPHWIVVASLGPIMMCRDGDRWQSRRTEFEPWDSPQQFEIVTGIAGPTALRQRDRFWDFFPTLDRKAELSREDFRLVPFSMTFWEHYCEPIDWFLEAAVSFSNAIRAITGDSENPIVEHGGRHLDRKGGLDRLTAMASGVSPVVTMNDAGEIVSGWRAPSLLAHLAMQAIQDIVGETRIGLCRCGRPFVKTNQRQTHCNNVCGDRFRKRDERARKKANRRRR